MEDLISNAWRSCFRPRDRRPIYEWAADFVNLSPPITRTGAFDVSASRHFIKIFDSLQDDHCRETNVLKPVRGGGSLIGDVFCPWTFANDPGQYMDIFQTDRVADEHGQSRIHKIFRKCDVVRGLFPANRHDLCDAYIKFSTGHEWYLTGPGLANLQTKGIRYMRLEEVWMWAQGLMNEALGRLGDYVRAQTSKALAISQGGPMPNVPMLESDWYRHYHRGEVWEWEVQCPACQKYFDPVFSGQRNDGSFYGITWDHHKTPAGDWDISKCCPSVRFECPHCKHPMLDSAKTKLEWNRTGQYRITTEPNRKRQSFHWEAVIDYPWGELVELWLDACNAERRGDLKPKLQFYQKRRAMFKDEESLMKSGLHLSRSTYEINSDWPEEKGRFLSIDRQGEDLFWWTVRAWSPSKSRRLAFGKAYGFAALEEIRVKWKVEQRKTFIDSGFQPKGDQGVYAACVRFNWVALKGDKDWQFTHQIKSKRAGEFKRVHKSYAPLSWGDPSAGTAMEGRKYAPLIRFSKNQMNQKVQELIESGVWEEPPFDGADEMEKEYNAQMSARVKKTEFDSKTGETRVYWKETQNDHARDLANMQVLGAILMDLLPDPVLERQTTTEKKESE